MSPSTQKRLKKYFEEVTVTTSCNMNTLILDFLLETEIVCVHKGGSHTFKDSSHVPQPSESFAVSVIKRA